MLGQGQHTEALHWTVHGHKHVSCSTVKEAVLISQWNWKYLSLSAQLTKKELLFINEEYLCKCMQLIWCILAICIHLNTLFCSDLIKDECKGGWEAGSPLHWHSFSTYCGQGWLIVVQMNCWLTCARTRCACVRRAHLRGEEHVMQDLMFAAVDIRHAQAHNSVAASPAGSQCMSRAGISGSPSVCIVCTHSFTFVPPLSAHSSTASGHSLPLSKDTQSKPLANPCRRWIWGCQEIIITGS